MSKPRRKPLGSRNIIGHNVTAFRKASEYGNGTGLSRPECQDRLVQDFELPIPAKALGMRISDLLDLPEE